MKRNPENKGDPTGCRLLCEVLAVIPAKAGIQAVFLDSGLQPARMTMTHSEGLSWLVVTAKS